MSASRSFTTLVCTTALVAGIFAFSPLAEACTRFVYHGASDQIMTARSMDWVDDIDTNLWIFPRGMKRSGEAGKNSLQWTSKYGSVIASGYDISTTDGMNEAGLTVSLLWLSESVYPKQDGKTPGLTIAAWGQYVLDSFATVDEAVKVLSKQTFIPVTAGVPGQNRMATVHLAISDPSGDSAIIEYVAGKQTIHHGKQYQVMTNSPVYDQQLALNTYWQQIGGTVMLPGTNRASDRFARADFYANVIPKTDNPVETVASVLSVIRNTSVPYGISTAGEPNISSTRWRTVSDHKRKLYFFESAMSPNTFWVDLKNIDFSKETGKVKKLDLGPNQRNIFAGEANDKFVDSQPFVFLGEG